MIKADGTPGTQTLMRGYKTQYVYQLGRNWIDVYTDETPAEIAQLRKKHKLIEGIVVPCGKCYQCKLNKAYDKAKRVWADSSYYTYHYFVTYTYDDDHLRYKQAADANGEIQEIPVLHKPDIIHVKEHLRDDSRKHGWGKIEYMLSGEYGNKKGRPHYHMILLTNDPSIQNTLYNADPSNTGHAQFGSTYLDDLWGRGLVVLSIGSTATAAYTARYTLKKAYKGDALKDRFVQAEIQQEFISTTPGIGKRYLMDNADQLIKDASMQVDQTKGVALPKYYMDKLSEMGYADEIDKIKTDNLKRRKADIKEIETHYNMPYSDYVVKSRREQTKRQYEL